MTMERLMMWGMDKAPGFNSKHPRGGFISNGQIYASLMDVFTYRCNFYGTVSDLPFRGVNSDIPSILKNCSNHPEIDLGIWAGAHFTGHTWGGGTDPDGYDHKHRGKQFSSSITGPVNFSSENNFILNPRCDTDDLYGWLTFDASNCYGTFFGTQEPSWAVKVPFDICDTISGYGMRTNVQYGFFETQDFADDIIDYVNIFIAWININLILELNVTVNAAINTFGRNIQMKSNADIFNALNAVKIAADIALATIAANVNFSGINLVSNYNSQRNLIITQYNVYIQWLQAHINGYFTKVQDWAIVVRDTIIQLHGQNIGVPNLSPMSWTPDFSLPNLTWFTVPDTTINITWTPLSFVPSMSINLQQYIPDWWIVPNLPYVYDPCADGVTDCNNCI